MGCIKRIFIKLHDLCTIYILKKDYHNVCDILSSILYFNNKSGRVFQKRDKYALLLLLEGEFKNEEDT